MHGKSSGCIGFVNMQVTDNKWFDWSYLQVAGLQKQEHFGHYEWRENGRQRAG
jgi:hypothetical protein